MRDHSLYRKVYDAIRKEIESGALKPGDRLPPEGELSGLHGVSLITVKKALSLLTEEGILRRIPGKGSFVMEGTGQRTQPVLGTLTALPVIGLVFEHATIPFGLEIIYTLDKLATLNGYKLMIGFSYGDREKETREIQNMIALGAKGIVIMPSHGPYYNTDILRLVVENYPVVLIDKELEGIPVSSVCTDNENAVAVLVRHLAEQGRKRIGMISTLNPAASSIAERRSGYFKELAVHRLEPGPEHRLELLTFERTINPDPYAEIKEFLQEKHREMDSIICTEYGFLPHLVKAAEELGLSIPGDLAVCCIDGDDLAPGGYFYTHAKQNEEEIGRKAMSLLLERIEGKVAKARRYNIPAVFRQGRSS